MDGFHQLTSSGRIAECFGAALRRMEMLFRQDVVITPFHSHERKDKQYDHLNRVVHDTLMLVSLLRANVPLSTEESRAWRHFEIEAAKVLQFGRRAYFNLDTMITEPEFNRIQRVVNREVNMLGWQLGWALRDTLHMYSPKASPAKEDFDPCIAMQIEEFESFVTSMNASTWDGTPRIESICNWTHTILIDCWCRIGPLEAEKLAYSFRWAYDWIRAESELSQNGHIRRECGR